MYVVGDGLREYIEAGDRISFCPKFLDNQKLLLVRLVIGSSFSTRRIFLYLQQFVISKLFFVSYLFNF